jgi:hypothetical protein
VKGVVQTICTTYIIILGRFFKFRDKFSPSFVAPPLSWDMEKIMEPPKGPIDIQR